MTARLHLLAAFLILLIPQLASSYAPNGKCGKQFGGAFCDIDQGCCSVNGYCGVSAQYCLVSNGCQSNCTDGAPTASIAPVATTVTTTATPTSTAATASASSTAEASAGTPLTRNVIIGIIAAVVGLFLLAGIGIFCYKRHKTKTTESMQQIHNNHEIRMAEARRSEQMLSIVERHGPRAIQGIPRLQLTGVDRELNRSPPYGRVLGDLD